mgnify:CR=1 FL=1
MAKRKKRDQLSQGSVPEETMQEAATAVQPESSSVMENQAPQAEVTGEAIKDDAKSTSADLDFLEFEKIITDVEPIKTDTETPVEPVFNLKSAAIKLIYDYREGWEPAIKIRARMSGVDPDKEHTLKVWKEVFIAWGLSLIHI